MGQAPPKEAQKECHEMTDQKWPVLLMCRDSISEGFFHTRVRRRRTSPAPPRVKAPKGCSGFQSEPPNSQFAQGAAITRSLFEFGDARGSGSGVWHRLADRKQTTGLEKRRQQAPLLRSATNQPRTLYEGGGVPPVGRPAPAPGEVRTHFLGNNRPSKFDREHAR
jgi:hypothetical protein